MSQIQRPSRWPVGSEPPDPMERLKQLNIELTQEQARQTHIGQQVTNLQADITDLTKTVAEVKATLTDYAGQIKDLESRLHSQQYFYDQKSKMIMAAIGDKKGPIDELITEFDHEIGAMQTRLAELNDRVISAQQESQRAAAEQNEKQAEYDHAKAYTSDVLAKLSDLDTLRASITTADDATDVASMYFLVLEFQNTLDSTEIISQHRLALDLRHKLGELEEAKERARVKSAALNGLQTEATALQATLDGKRAGRRATLLAEVQALFPVQPATSPAAQTSTTAAAAQPAAAASTGATPAATQPVAAASTSPQAKPGQQK